jgi:hypothetical protein
MGVKEPAKTTTSQLSEVTGDELRANQGWSVPNLRFAEVFPCNMQHIKVVCDSEILRLQRQRDCLKLDGV